MLGRVAFEEWTTAEPVERYLQRADQFPRRGEGESVVLGLVPAGACRVLDLGTGDGRLLALLQRDRAEMHGVGLDLSKIMLRAAARRFAGDGRVELVEHDLVDEILTLGRFDAVGELLEHEDPSDRLLDVETQLSWLREIGFDDVDCYWKWRELAVLAAIKPSGGA